MTGRRVKKLNQIIVLSAFSIFYTAASAANFCVAEGFNSNKLWEVVKKYCVETKTPDHVQCLTENKNFVVFKSNQIPPHYLLIPTLTVTGIESPEMWRSGYPAYFSEAWRQRYIAAAQFGNKPEQVGIAINSACNRSQNQLHVHMNCIKPSVTQELENIKWKINEKKWIKIKINSQQNYYAKRMPGADIPNNLMQDFLKSYPSAAHHPDRQSFFATSMHYGSLGERAVVLRSEYRKTNPSRYPGHAEDLLTSCAPVSDK